MPAFVPVPLRTRSDGWTPLKQAEFLGYLAETRSVAEAARRVNMARETKLLASGIHFGEGPRWRDGRLWFSDFQVHAVKSCSPPRRSAHARNVSRSSGWGQCNARRRSNALREGRVSTR